MPKEVVRRDRRARSRGQVQNRSDSFRRSGSNHRTIENTLRSPLEFCDKTIAHRLSPARPGAQHHRGIAIVAGVPARGHLPSLSRLRARARLRLSHPAHYRTRQTPPRDHSCRLTWCCWCLRRSGTQHASCSLRVGAALLPSDAVCEATGTARFELSGGGAPRGQHFAVAQALPLATC